MSALFAFALPPAASFAGPFFIMADRPYSENEMVRLRVDLGRGAGEGYGYAEEDTAPADEYGGVDVRVYKIADPLAFLQSQKNLHRPQITPYYRGESVLNGLRQLWSRIYQDSRRLWQRLFSLETRTTVTAAHPELKQAQPGSYATDLRSEPKFIPIPGYDIVREFRYPILKAKPVTPPTDVLLAGSSSEFLPDRQGDASIPVGKLKPGLYLSEVSYGDHAAYAVVFVSNTVLITKTSAAEMFVWAADLTGGTPKGGVTIQLSDGVTVLEQGKTETDGSFRIVRGSLERSYLFGLDADGGIAVSENFYFDSEIYGLKLYVTTDRPLYQPGDEVAVKVMDREFLDALKNQGLEADAEYAVSVSDSRGQEILSRRVTLAAGNAGGDFSFVLAENSLPGGYSIKLTRDSQGYVGAFRVQKYAKPLFDLSLVLAKDGFKPGEEVRGTLSVKQPFGRPIANAKVRLVAFTQPYTMVSGRVVEPVHQKTQVLDKEFVTGAAGSVAFTLPKQDKPSRIIIRAFASDASAAKVSLTKEVLVTGFDRPLTIVAPGNLSAPGTAVVFSVKDADTDKPAAGKLEWTAVRLEDQSRLEGKVGEGGVFSVKFAKGGAYTLHVKNETGETVATESHWVSGGDLKGAGQEVEIVAKQAEYLPGEEAKFVILFGTDVSDALVTLERDKVHEYALLSSAQPWIKLHKVSARQYEVAVKLTTTFAPNIMFSVLAVKDGQYFFENKGIRVKMPELKIDIVSDKEDYQPRDEVTLTINTSVDGKPVPAAVTLGVVDEMVYILQPEIAPDITQFFYHPRRNQVRTWASLDFHTYNMATAGEIGEKQAVAPSYRPLKLRERPRRDERDTAAFFPLIRTDTQGTATVKFELPDAITRWRITARGMDEAGLVGQATRYLKSQQDVYIKWAAAKQFRQGDRPDLRFILYNQTSAAWSGNFTVEGLGFTHEQKVALPPGETPVTVPLKAGLPSVVFTVPGRPHLGGTVNARLWQGSPDAFGDSLNTQVSVAPAGWTFDRTETRPLTSGKITLAPEGGFTDLRVTVSSGLYDEVMRLTDQLLDYPYGCVEQVASRLLPLTVLRSRMTWFPKPEEERYLTRLVETGRNKLVNLVGSAGSYGWWGDLVEGSGLMTTYATLALGEASRSLGAVVPAKVSKRVLDAYTKHASTMGIDHRALTVWVAGEEGLPIENIRQGVRDDLLAAKDILKLDTPLPEDSNYFFFGAPSSAGSAHDRNQIVFAALVLDSVKRVSSPAPVTGSDTSATAVGTPATVGMPGDAVGTPVDPDWDLFVDTIAADVDRNLLQYDPLIVAAGLMRDLTKGRKALSDAKGTAVALLNRVSYQTPTIERALALVFVTRHVAGERTLIEGVAPALQADWDLIPRPSLLGNAYQLKPGKTTGTLDVVADAAGTAAQLVVSYKSTIAPKTRIPVELTRKIFALRPTDDGSGEYRATPVNPLAAAIDPNLIYLDMVTVASEQPFSFAVLDVPLPSGAAVESTTWGVKIPLADIDPSHVDVPVPVEDDDDDDTQADATATDTGTATQTGPKMVVKKVYLDLRDNATYQETAAGYAVPIAQLSGLENFFRLIRFTQPGDFQIPSLRFATMYREGVAFEKGMDESALKKMAIH